MPFHFNRSFPPLSSISNPFSDIFVCIRFYSCTKSVLSSSSLSFLFPIKKPLNNLSLQPSNKAEKVRQPHRRCFCLQMAQWRHLLINLTTPCRRILSGTLINSISMLSPLILFHRKCWLESSFVGTRPLDSPQTPDIDRSPPSSDQVQQQHLQQLHTHNLHLNGSLPPVNAAGQPPLRMNGLSRVGGGGGESTIYI